MSNEPKTETPKVDVPPTVQTVRPPLEESTVDAPSRAPYIEMAQDDNWQWHWCLWSANGRAMAASITPFPRRNDCQKNVNTVLELMRNPHLTIVATLGE